MISAVSIYRIITSSTVRSIWQSTYSSVSRAWEAEITFSVSPEGETRPLCSPPAALQGSFQVLYLSSNWWLNVPSMLQRFPEGNSKLYFKNWDWCPAAYLFPSCFLGIYFIWFCWGDIIPWFLWTCFQNPVSLEWPESDVCRLVSLKGSPDGFVSKKVFFLAA